MTTDKQLMAVGRLEVERRQHISDQAETRRGQPDPVIVAQTGVFRAAASQDPLDHFTSRCGSTVHVLGANRRA